MSPNPPPPLDRASEDDTLATVLTYALAPLGVWFLVVASGAIYILRQYNKEVTLVGEVGDEEDWDERRARGRQRHGGRYEEGAALRDCRGMQTTAAQRAGRAASVGPKVTRRGAEGNAPFMPGAPEKRKQRLPRSASADSRAAEKNVEEGARLISQTARGSPELMKRQGSGAAPLLGRRVAIVGLSGKSAELNGLSGLARDYGLHDGVCRYVVRIDHTSRSVGLKTSNLMLLDEERYEAGHCDGPGKQRGVKSTAKANGGARANSTQRERPRPC